MSDEPTQTERICQVVALIPIGRVSSYGRIAALAGYPRGHRIAARVLSRLPAGSRVPWHRVITANGYLAFPKGTASFRQQAARLRAEGVIVRAGRVAMARYVWEGD
jgi:methylated-DNA-protein-cysteine methyltransferase related protein